MTRDRGKRQGDQNARAAEDLLAEYLASITAGQAEDFGTFKTRHPALAAELERLWTQRQRLRLALGAFARSAKDERPGARRESGAEPDTGSNSESEQARLDDLRRFSTQPGTARYTDSELIGSGSMGRVHSVWDHVLQRRVAMKVIAGAASMRSPAFRRRLARFEREARILGGLDHPNIVPVHDLGFDDKGEIFFTMPIVNGRHFGAVLLEAASSPQAWPRERLLDVVARICDAMSYSHSRGVVHRDLKPSNIMVGRFGEVLVMDWGLATVLGLPDDRDIRLRSQPPPPGSEVRGDSSTRSPATVPDSTLMTMDGDVLGTPAYMSPEQASGRIEQMGPASDVYAVGAMLYHILTGRMPYVIPGEHMDGYAIVNLVRAGEPPRVGTVAPAAPPEIVAICEKAMARQPGDRYADMTALASDLRAFIHQRVVSAFETGAVAELRKWIVRNKPLALALAAGVLVLIGGLATSLVFKSNSDRNAAAAEANAAKAQQAAAIADERRLEADEQRKVAQDQEALAVQKASEVLSLAAIQELKDLTDRADALWPAAPEMVPGYERWLAEARVLVDGSATHPGLKDHERMLAQIRERADPLTPEQIEQDRRTSPSFTEWENSLGRLTWMRRMLGEEPWPTEAEAELELAKKDLPADANALNSMAWRLVAGEEKVVYGNEVEGLNLARRAFAAATDAERTSVRVTLVWAFFRCGRLQQAVAELQAAIGEANDQDKAKLMTTSVQIQEQVVRWAPGEPLSERAAEASRLAAHISELERDLGERRTFTFSDPIDRWWNTELAQLVTGLTAFTDEKSGLDSEGTSVRHGWGIGKRAAFARTIEERSVSGEVARRRWTDAIDAIAKSPRYGGLTLTPQLGLLPLGVDGESQLWEFWHLQSGDEPHRGADGKIMPSESMGMVLVLIPGGAFLMGAQNTDPSAQNYDKQAGLDVNPVHEVTLSAYFLSKYEMTQSQWQLVVGANPSFYHPGMILGSHAMSPMHPVECVTWDDATEILGRMGLGLPTEAQWERAARGGTDTPWSVGSEQATLIRAGNFADRALYSALGKPKSDWPVLDDGWASSAPVGTFRANAFGLYDVHGNVAEWCRDSYLSSYYRTSSSVDPVCYSPNTDLKCNRGGASAFDVAFSRSAVRSSSAPKQGGPGIGVRPAKAITP